MKINMTIRTGVILFTFLTGILILASCIKKEDYPDIPEISYRGFTKVFDTGQYPIKGILSIDFQDGNGDIGLDPGDTLPPFQPGGDYYYNMIIRYFEKQNGVWVEPILPVPYNARIPVLTPDQPNKAIKGYIVDTLDLDPTPAFDTIKFEVFIYDRALNQSNVVATPEIPLK
jgi:hypothetical protein